MSKPLPSGGPILVLDAACPGVFAGLWQDSAWLVSRSVKTPALDSLFGLVEECLDATDTHLEELAGFAYDEGPGSVLGIRVTAMALRIWRAMPALKSKPVFAYRSLELLAAQLADDRAGENFVILADYRKDAWITLRSGGDIAVVADADISPELPLYYLRQRKAWRSPPERAVEVTLDLSADAQLLCDEKQLRAVEQPGVYTVKPVEYKRWQPG